MNMVLCQVFKQFVLFQIFHHIIFESDSNCKILRVTKSSNLESEIFSITNYLNEFNGTFVLIIQIYETYKIQLEEDQVDNPDIKSDFIQSIQWMILRQRYSLDPEKVIYHTLIVIDKQNQPPCTLR